MVGEIKLRNRGCKNEREIMFIFPVPSATILLAHASQKKKTKKKWI